MSPFFEGIKALQGKGGESKQPGHELIYHLCEVNCYLCKSSKHTCTCSYLLSDDDFNNIILSTFALT